MNTNYKRGLAALALVSVAAAGMSYSFAAESSTDTTTTTKQVRQHVELTDEQKVQMEAMRTLMDKQRNGETLTDAEQTQLDELKSNMPQRGGMGDREGRMGGGDRGGKGGFGMMERDLTDEEKTALESMTDDEKKVFFETKREEFQAQRDAEDSVIDKLLAGQTLTADEELVRKDLITQRAERKAQAEERKAQMEAVKALMEKKKAGETLTDEEQAQLDQMKGFGMRGGERGPRGGAPDVTDNQ